MSVLETFVNSNTAQTEARPKSQNLKYSTAIAKVFKNRTILRIRDHLSSMSCGPATPTILNIEQH